ncbi:MAG: hypothetical protein KDB27_23635 [Planctomycetales bacterium]|nr:hypothetical protein [Planctomycetales bacterium]
MTIAIEQIATVRVNEGSPAILEAAFQDSASPDSYSASIRWGDDSTSDGAVQGPGTQPGRLRVRVDYRFDENNFFLVPERRAAVEQAVQSVVDNFDDRLAAIESVGNNRFNAIVRNPSGTDDEQLDNFSVAENEIVVFVGTRDLDDVALALGGSGGYSSTGSAQFRELIETRGQAAPANVDFAPWGGQISFNAGTNWYFGQDADKIPSNAFDFRTVAQHEMLHLLGFNDRIEAFSRHVTGDAFTGPLANAEYAFGRNIPLASDLAHWADSVAIDSVRPLMIASINPGERKSVTRLDTAAMQDIGWTASSELPGAVTAFHAYADDGIYDAVLTLSTNRDAAVAPFRVEVANVAPTLTGIDLYAVGQQATFDAAIVDPGMLDSHSISIDWGDSGAATQFSADAEARRVLANHTYASGGEYTVSISVADDDGASHRYSLTLQVEGTANTSDWQNADLPLDVNRDAAISPIDALLVINELNRPTVTDGRGKLPPMESVDGTKPLTLFDVNGDHYVTAADALKIINQLNHNVTATAARSLVADAASTIDWLFALAQGFDESLDRTKRAE